MTRMRVLHRKMEPIFPSPQPSPNGRRSEGEAGENRQISGSPPGVPSPDSLPSEIKILRQRRVSNRADKEAGNGIQPIIASLREAIPKSQGDCHAALVSIQLDQHRLAVTNI
jgi:hypothetical protein